MIRPTSDLLPHWNRFEEELKKDLGSDPTLKIISHNIYDATSDADKFKIVKALSWMHEVKASTSEFKVFQKSVALSESADYVQTKPELSRVISDRVRPVANLEKWLPQD